MKQIIILLFIVIAPNFLIAQDDTWIEVAKSKDNQPVFMKNAVANIDDYGIQVWIKQPVLSFKTIKGVVYKNTIMKTLYSFNCSQNKIQTRTTIMYSSKGTVIASYKRPEYENSLDYEDIIPETLGEQLLNKACELFNN